MAAMTSEDENPRGASGGPKRPHAGSLSVGKQSKRISKRERKQKDVKMNPDPPPTKIIQTDAANFRMLVQELTSGSPAPSPAPSPVPSPAPSASPQGSPHPHGSPHPPGSKTNQRLRNLAPPPIRPTAVNATAVGFRPVPPRTSTPAGQTSSLPASDSADAASGLLGSGTSRAMAQFPFGMPGSPYAMFSPHFLSPVPLLSPRDMFCVGHLDSPGSLAMREMAMMAMAQAMGAREASGLSTPRAEGLPQSGSMSAPPLPHMHPMLHPSYGMFPAFAAGFAMGPAMAASMAGPGVQMVPAAPVASQGGVHVDTPTSVQDFAVPR